jgi:hypothetical protein
MVKHRPILHLLGREPDLPGLADVVLQAGGAVGGDGRPEGDQLGQSRVEVMA